MGDDFGGRNIAKGEADLKIIALCKTVEETSGKKIAGAGQVLDIIDL